jgi:hypothetical protein
VQKEMERVKEKEKGGENKPQTEQKGSEKEKSK